MTPASGVVITKVATQYGHARQMNTVGSVIREAGVVWTPVVTCMRRTHKLGTQLSVTSCRDTTRSLCADSFADRSLAVRVNAWLHKRWCVETPEILTPPREDKPARAISRASVTQVADSSYIDQANNRQKPCQTVAQLSQDSLHVALRVSAVPQTVHQHTGFQSPVAVGIPNAL